MRSTLRPFATLLALGIGAGALAAAHTSALADERMLDAGAQLLSYARVVALDPARTLIVNGLPVHVVSGTTQDEVADVLDTFHARCRRSSAGLDRLPHELPGARRWPRIAERALDPVLRHQDPRRGYVACLDLGADRLRPEDLLHRIARFLESRDLAEVGDLRFVWAFRDAAATTYVGVYTQGSVPLSTLFPSHGDAPGADVAGVPRPANARRVLSAFQRDASPMLASYERAAAPDATLSAFREQLARSGLSPRAIPGQQAALYVTDARGGLGALAFASAADRGRTLLTIVRLH